MGKLVLAMGSLTSFSLSEIQQKENNQKWSSENAYFLSKCFPNLRP